MRFIYRAKYHSCLNVGSGAYWWRKLRMRIWEQFWVIIIGIASIIEGLIGLLSLGFLGSDLRAWILFDVLADENFELPDGGFEP